MNQIWETKKIKGWGDAISIVREGQTRPILNTVRDINYFTDYPQRTDENGDTWTTCSERAAIEEGNYVATPEIREAILKQEEADAKLAAAAPELLAALQAFVHSIYGGASREELDTMRQNAEAAIQKAIAQ